MGPEECADGTNPGECAELQAEAVQTVNVCLDGVDREEDLRSKREKW